MNIKPTTEKLAEAMEARNNPRLAKMIIKARAGFYDDYKSHLPTPIMQLVLDLIEAGETELAELAKRGQFDGTPEEAAEWAKSPEGRSMFNEVFGEGFTDFGDRFTN